jgi:hypothetical protein
MLREPWSKIRRMRRFPDFGARYFDDPAARVAGILRSLIG